jgi:sugar phosphate permease
MQLAASLVAGLLWDKIGHESVFLFGVASSLMGIVALMLMLRQQPAPAVQSGKS